MFLKSPHQGLSKKYDTIFSLETKRIWSPSNNGGLYDGNEIFSITI